MNLHRYVARSNTPVARFLKKLYRGVTEFSLPVPRVLARLALIAFLAARFVVYFCKRVFVVEPLWKAYCTTYGRGFRADIYVPWVQGKGRLILGNDVKMNGHVSVTFAARYSDAPTLTIGDDTGIGHLSSFIVGKSISIGNHCRIAGNVWVFDSSGHPTDPTARLAGAAAADSEVRPVRIEDNVWIGARATIFPGVTIGTGSVVSGGAVVMTDVPPYTVVAGNPARKVAALTPPTSPEPATAAQS